MKEWLLNSQHLETRESWKTSRIVPYNLKFIHLHFLFLCLLIWHVLGDDQWPSQVYVLLYLWCCLEVTAKQSTATCECYMNKVFKINIICLFAYLFVPSPPKTPTILRVCIQASGVSTRTSKHRGKSAVRESLTRLLKERNSQ